MTIKVLFVCMGNICRSPTGEGVFRHYVDDQASSNLIESDSAGTLAYHSGEPADQRMCDAASTRGYQLDSIARLVTADDLTHFDLVVAMDRDNYVDLVELNSGEAPNIKMLGEFIPGDDTNVEPPSVPDPYYGGVDGFEAVIDMIESACPAMLDHCLNLIAQRE
jgi:protein-tyrosine phosphatase